MSLRLEVRDWAFWSPTTCDPLAWRGEVESPAEPLKARDVPAESIPPLHRRRMSSVCRMGLQAALGVAEGVTADYFVFCSRHGEVERSESLIDAIVAGCVLSPTDFSLSVHNTSAGMYSIITGLHAPSTSIASGESSFVSGWLEAEGFLDSRRDASVLIVNHDSVPPLRYNRFLRSASHAFALALLVSVACDGNGITLSLKGECEDDEAAKEAIGPAFLAWWLSGDGSLTVAAERQKFEWSR